MDDEVRGLGPRIYFHHIGKTAGTSFRRFLLDRVGEANVSPMLRGVKFADAMREFVEFQVIAGHVEPLPSDRLPHDRVCVTLLRDPIDRVLSDFFFRRNAYELDGGSVPADAAGLDAWLDERLADGPDTLNGQLQALWPFGWSMSTLPPLDEQVNAARRALDAFDVVGLQSRMAQTLAAFAATVGWDVPNATPHENVTPARISASDLSSHTHRRLREALAADYEVYAYAQKRFEQRGTQAPRTLTAPWVAAVDGSPGEQTERASTSPPAAHDPSHEITVTRVAIRGHVSEDRGLRVGEWTTIEVYLRSTIVEADLTVGISIRDHAGALVFGTNTRVLGDRLEVTPGDFVVYLQFVNNLGLGTYSLSVAAHRATSHFDRSFDRQDDVLAFEIIDRIGPYFEGRVRLDFEASATPISPGTRIETIPLELGDSAAMVLGHRNVALIDPAARISLVRPMSPLRRGADATMLLHIENRGHEAWPAFGRRAVRVAYHWYDPTGTTIDFDGVRTPLPHDVAPGAELRLSCFVRAPDVAGELHLVWTLVQEGVAWFDTMPSASQLVCAARVV